MQGDETGPRNNAVSQAFLNLLRGSEGEVVARLQHMLTQPSFFAVAPDLLFIFPTPWPPLPSPFLPL